MSTAPEQIWAWPTCGTIEGDVTSEWRWVHHYHPIDLVQAGQAWTVPCGIAAIEYTRSDLLTDTKVTRAVIKERNRCISIVEDKAPVTQDGIGDECRAMCDEIIKAILATV